MSLTRDYIKQLMAYIDHKLNKPQRLVLGGGPGNDGGSGIPPGGIIGQLSQRYICFDTTEATTAGSTSTCGSAPCLVQNLNRIRGGWAIGDEAIGERHLLWATNIGLDPTGSIESRHVPFYSTSGLIASENVRDAIEETYAGGLGAGSDAQYLVLALHASLTDERVFTEGPGIDVVDGGAGNTYTLGLGVDTILLVRCNGNPAVEYPATAAGLDAASAAAGGGDLILLPTIPIGDAHTLAGGVHYRGLSRWGTLLTGQITAGGSTPISLECLTIRRGANDASTLKGLVANSVSDLHVRDCEIDAQQDGAGDCYAVSVEADGLVEIWCCHTSGSSQSGDGYAVYRATGTVNIYGGRAWGSTEPFLGD